MIKLPSDVLSVSAVTVCELIKMSGWLSPGAGGKVTVPVAKVPAGFKTTSVTPAAAASVNPVVGV